MLSLHLSGFVSLSESIGGLRLSYSARVRWGDRISCCAALDITACADFIEEIRMNCANAKNLDRRSGEHGAPVQGRGLVWLELVLTHPLRSDVLSIM